MSEHHEIDLTDIPEAEAEVEDEAGEWEEAECTCEDDFNDDDVLFITLPIGSVNELAAGGFPTDGNQALHPTSARVTLTSDDGEVQGYLHISSDAPPRFEAVTGEGE